MIHYFFSICCYFVFMICFPDSFYSLCIYGIHIYYLSTVSSGAALYKIIKKVCAGVVVCGNCGGNKTTNPLQMCIQILYILYLQTTVPGSYSTDGMGAWFFTFLGRKCVVVIIIYYSNTIVKHYNILNELLVSQHHHLKLSSRQYTTYYTSTIQFPYHRVKRDGARKGRNYNKKEGGVKCNLS